MIDKETREKRLEQVAAKIAELRQEDTIGGVLAFLAASPFADDHAADFLINGLIATSTPEALAQAYNLSGATAQVLHGAAVAAVTVKSRPPKNASGLLTTVASILEKIRADKNADAPASDCQCPGCTARRAAEASKNPDGSSEVAMHFDTNSPEEAQEKARQFAIEVGKGRNPFEVMTALGGRIASAEEVAETSKADFTVLHIDTDGNPLTKH